MRAISNIMSTTKVKEGHDDRSDNNKDTIRRKHNPE